MSYDAYTEHSNRGVDEVVVENSASSHKDARSFLKNSIMLSIMSLMVSALGFIYRVYIARYFGSSGFGAYLFVITFIDYFGVISLFGFRNVIVRQVAAQRDQTGSYTRAGLELRLVSSSIALILAIAVTFLLKKANAVEVFRQRSDIEVLIFAYALSIPAVAITDILHAVILGLERSEFSALSTVISNVLKIGIGIALIICGYGLLSVFIVFTATSAFNAFLNWIFLHKKLRVVLPSAHSKLREVRRYVFFEALPFWYITLICKVYYRNDILILGWLKGNKVLGVYGAAYMAIDLLLLLGGAITTAVYPVLSRAYVTESQRVSRYYELLSKYVFLVFAPVCIAISVLAPKLVPFILGKGYQGSVPALRVLIWMVLFETLTLVGGNVLAATGNQKKQAILAAGIAAVSFLLTLGLVKAWGYMGAAWATTFGAVVSFLGTSWLVSKLLKSGDLVRVLIAPLFAVVAMGLVTRMFGESMVYAGLTSGVLVYVVLLFACHIITEEEKQVIRTILRVRKASNGIRAA